MKTASPLPGNLQWKAVLAFLLPAVGTLVLAVLNEALSPDMDPTLKVAIVGLVNAVLAFAGAWAGTPAPVVVKGNEERDLHEAVGA